MESQQIQDKAITLEASKQQLIKNLWKLVNSKSLGAQLKTEDLYKLGLSEEKHDSVREAVTKVFTKGKNLVTLPFLWVFSQTSNFADTVIKVVLTLIVFLFCLQVPYVNERANLKLQTVIAEAEFNINKYEVTMQQLNEILVRYKKEGVDPSKDIPEQMRTDKEKAQRWLGYKNKTVQTIWGEVSRQPFESKDKLDDLKMIYEKTFVDYQPGLPMNKDSYIRAALISMIFLLVFIVLQSIIISSINNVLRFYSFQSEVKKVL
jgi:hypothetical protein